MGHGLVFVQTNERGYDKEALEWLKENFKCVYRAYISYPRSINHNGHSKVENKQKSPLCCLVLLFPIHHDCVNYHPIWNNKDRSIDLFYLEENLVQYQLDFISGEFLSKNDATRFDYGMFEVHRKDSKKHALTFIPKKIEGERCMWNLDRCSSGMQMKKSLWSIDGIGFSFSSLLRFDVDLCFVCGTFELFIDVIHTIFPRSCFDSSQSNRS